MGKKNQHNTWVNEHREILLKSGVQAAVFENELAWNLFLEDGEFAATPDVPFDADVDLLTQEKAMILCDFLTVEFPERNDGLSPYRSLNRLEYLLKRGPHAA